MIGKDFPGSRIEVIYPDREASLWIGTNHGMARLSMEGATASEKQAGYSVQLLPTSDPLASNAVVSFLEDREGDLWVGAETAGLQIFRESRFGHWARGRASVPMPQRPSLKIERTFFG